MENPYLPYPVKVEKITIENDARDLKTFDLSFVNEEDEKRFKYMPGQFGFLSILGEGEAAFGIASSPTEEGIIKYTVKRMGVVTSALHSIEEGVTIGMRGPYGNHYPFDKMENKDVVIISGGSAFTTLRSTIVYMLHPHNRERFKRIICIYGARTAGELLYKDELKEWEKGSDIEIHITVDKLNGDPWPKCEGSVAAVSRDIAPSPEGAIVLVCGQPIMIKSTQLILDELGFKGEQVYVSLENRMKCGIGKCGHCNIGNKYVCKNGPIFSVAELANMPKEY